MLQRQVRWDFCLRKHTHTHTHTHARTHASTHVRTHARTHARTYARTHARARTRTHTHTHTHAHTHTLTRRRTLMHMHTHSHARMYAQTHTTRLGAVFFGTNASAFPSHSCSTSTLPNDSHFSATRKPSCFYAGRGPLSSTIICSSSSRNDIDNRNSRFAGRPSSVDVPHQRHQCNSSQHKRQQRRGSLWAPCAAGDGAAAPAGLHARTHACSRIITHIHTRKDTHSRTLTQRTYTHTRTTHTRTHTHTHTHTHARTTHTHTHAPPLPQTQTPPPSKKHK